MCFSRLLGHGNLATKKSICLRIRALIITNMYTACMLYVPIYIYLAGNQAMDANFYNEHRIVDEKSFSNLSVSNDSKFTDATQFASLEFYTRNYGRNLEIKDIGNECQSMNVPLAQIIQWRWNEKGQQMIVKSNIFNMGEEMRLDIATNDSIIVRILKERENIENPCYPLDSLDDSLTIHIGDSEVIVSAHWLMSVSPVINRMLSVEMREKQQRSITLNELGVDMEQFLEFLEAISPFTLESPNLIINPNNVLMLLKLADYFQVDWLKKRCEAHLINCAEIPLIDRFFLIDRYQLDNLKNSFLRFGVANLRTFFKGHRDQLLSLAANSTSAKFFCEFSLRLAG